MSIKVSKEVKLIHETFSKACDEFNGEFAKILGIKRSSSYSYSAEDMQRDLDEYRKKKSKKSFAVINGKRCKLLADLF